jgi:outer membrane beta-barrel protein
MKKILLSVSGIKQMAMVLLAVVILLPVSARAEIKAGSVEITPFGGFNLFEKSQNLKDNFLYGGRLGYNFTKYFGVEGAVEFINTGVDNTSIVGAKEGQYRATRQNGSPVNRVDMVSYHVDAVYHFMPEGNFNPFIVAGIGGTHYRPSISTDDMTTINFGVGAKYWLADNIALRVDVRDNVVSELFQEAYHNINATAGIVFAFGGAEKSSSAAKSEPAAAAVVEDKDTTAPYVTLVIPYNGSEDVPLQRKVRAAFSESMDPATINAATFTLYQGTTPVPGKVATPTDKTASFTEDTDLTPGTQYTGRITTGVKDLAGNPLATDYVWSFTTAPAPDPKVVTKVEKKVIYISKLVVLEDAHFEFDKATLTPLGKEIIRQNIQIMKDNPDLKIRIAGYTSAAGTTEYNQGLSERRADTVMTFMVNEGGIVPERLDTIGYGETRPAVYEVNPSEHESKAAKANMRVLFEIIVK